MSLNLSVQYPGRVTAPDADYTYGSSKNETSPGAGDGTPYEIARANDIFGFQQALLAASSIIPSGNAETQLISEYTQAIVELASGRAFNYDESGVANAYNLDLRTNQQTPRSYFDGLIGEFTPGNNNTGASTANIAGLGIKTIFFMGAALRGGELLTTRKSIIEYDLGNDRLNLILKQDGGYVAVENASGRAYNYDETGAVNVYVLDVQTGQVGPKSFFDGLRADFYPGATNTSVSTADIAGLGVKNIFFNGAALAGGELSIGRKARIEYDLGNDRLNLFLQPGSAQPGGVVQSVFNQDGALNTGTGTIPADDTVPQNTEGNEFITVSITPNNSSNRLKIEAVLNIGHSAGGAEITSALFQDTIVNALAAVTTTQNNQVNTAVQTVLTFWMTAGTSSLTTFKIRSGSTVGGTITFNGASGVRRFGGAMASIITITEYKV